MSAFVRKFEFKPNDGGEIEGGHTVRSLVLQVAEPRGMTDREIERVLWLEVGEIFRARQVGEFRRTR